MSLAQEYDRWHERVYDADPSHADESSPWYRLVLEYLAPVQGQRVLEVACGRGGFLNLLAAKGARVFGADFSQAALLIGQRRLRNGHGSPARAALTRADAQSLPYADNSFDVVISCETIEHLPDPRAALREMARVCQSGGRLYLTTPNYANMMGLYEVYAAVRKRSRESTFTQPLDRVYLFYQIRRFLRSAGWEIVRSDGTVHSVVLPRREPVRLEFLEKSRAIRRLLSPMAFHYFLIGRKMGKA